MGLLTKGGVGRETTGGSSSQGEYKTCPGDLGPSFVFTALTLVLVRAGKLLCCLGNAAAA